MKNRQSGARPRERGSVKSRSNAIWSELAGGRLDRLSVLGLGILIGMATVLAADRAGERLTPASARRGSTGDEAAAGPAEISSSGWKHVLRRTMREFNTDRIPAVAAGATFYGLLALFPAVGAFVSLYGLFSNVDDARRQVLAWSGLLPEGAVNVLSEQMTRLAAAPHTELGATFAASLLLSLWSSNAGMKALIAGLNIAYEEKEARNLIVLNLVSLSFTFGAVIFSLVAVASIAAVPTTLAFLGLSDLSGVSLLRWPALLVIVAGMLSVLYRYGPSREHARWRWVTPGGLLATVGWVTMSLAYSVYVANFGHFDKTYGSLGAIIGFMTWIWLSLIVVLVGAELNSELEQETSVDTTTGPPRPRGRRGAVVADRRARTAH